MTFWSWIATPYVTPQSQPAKPVREIHNKSLVAEFGLMYTAYITPPTSTDAAVSELTLVTCDLWRWEKRPTHHSRWAVCCPATSRLQADRACLRQSTKLSMGNGNTSVPTVQCSDAWFLSKSSAPLLPVVVERGLQFTGCRYRDRAYAMHSAARERG